MAKHEKPEQDREGKPVRPEGKKHYAKGEMPMRPDIPLNIRKVISAVDARGMKRADVEARCARMGGGWWPGRILSWEKKGGELTAEQAWAAAHVLDLPFEYITDNAIELRDDNPPRRSSYESRSFMDQCGLFQLAPDEALRGLSVVGLMKVLDIDIPSATRALSDLAAERKQAMNATPVEPGSEGAAQKGARRKKNG